MRIWLRAFFSGRWLVWQKEESAKQSRIFVRLQNPWPLVLALAALITYFFFPLTAVVVLFFSFAGLSLIAYFWAVQMALHVQAGRKLRYAAVQVGDELEETIRVVNYGWLPALWTHLEDQSDFPLYTIGTVRGVNSRGFLEWRNHTICQQRGVFSLGPWSIITGDPFGLFHVQREYTQGQQMFVYPPLPVISETLIPQGKQQGDLRPLNQPLIAETVLSTHTRQFQPGDPLRHIHWRTTARKGETFVKVFDPEAASRIWFLPDLQASVHRKKDDLDSEETMILLIAGLAAQLLNDQRAVGLFVGGEKPTIVLPKPGPDYLWSILAAITPLHADQDTPLAENLLKASELISANDILIVITPSLSTDWMRNLSQITSTGSGSQAWALLLDPFSFGGYQHAERVLPILAGYDIVGRVVRPEDVQPQEGSYGALRRWEFITTATGKVIVRNTPRHIDDAAAESRGK